MPSPLDTLAKILRFEQEQGYRNTAVSGGLDKLSGKWQQEARRQLTGPQHLALIDEVIAALTHYPALDSREERAKVIQVLLARIVTAATAPRPSHSMSMNELSGAQPAEPENPSSQAFDSGSVVPPSADLPRPPTNSQQSAVAPLSALFATAPPAQSSAAGRPPQLSGTEAAPSAGQPFSAPPSEQGRSARDSQGREPAGRPRGQGGPEQTRRSRQTPRPAGRPPAPMTALPGENASLVEDSVVKREAEDVERRSNERPLPPLTPRPHRTPVGRDPFADRSAAGLGLNAPITALRGVGPKQTEHFRKLGVRIIRDLLFLFPRRYDDYSRLKPIHRLELGEEVTVIGTIWEVSVRRSRNGMPLTQAIISDGTGTIQVTWFNQPYLATRLRSGQQIVLSGKVDAYLGHLTFNSPEWEPLEREMLHTARLVPIYPLTQGMTAKWLRSKMKETVDYWAPRLPDYLPGALKARYNLVDLSTALLQVHFPDSWDSLAQARRRLDFDDILLLQLGLLQQRRAWQDTPAVPQLVSDEWLANWVARLPFTLTHAQQRSLEAIRADLAREVPMNRLLEGDVGSGKTVIAAAATEIAVHSGAQVALMAPTEILAEQHYTSLRKLLDLKERELLLLTGSTPESRKAEIRAGLAAGEIKLVIGTHALIQPGIAFQKLALVVIDEQHRFGVEQRARLRQKGYNPHVLVMTATPIPRTLALTMFGDLDLTILDEMPPGRTPIQTRIITPKERERAYAFVRRQIEKGRQAFIICPLVEESDRSEAKAAVEEYQRLQSQVFPDLKLGLLHGRMKAEEKEAVMGRFRAGELQILVATSVIEVGIDVPNATVMLIEGANRFGLAQLHQFRGRVGRGEHSSYCLLLTETAEDFGLGQAEERLKALESTTDGFRLAEIDLKLRGPGEFLGTRQSGLPETRLSSLADVHLIETAQGAAREVFAADPGLVTPENQALGRQVAAFWKTNTGGDVS